MATTIQTNFFTPEAIADPYALYDEVRPLGNVLWNDLMQAWNVFGFDEVSTVLADTGERFAERNGDPELICWFEERNMITVDGPEHRRLRSALTPMFTRSAVAKWEQRVREVVAELVAPLAEGNRSYDLITDFTMIPTVIVADMLGIPPEHYHDVRKWSHEIISSLAWGHENEEAVAIMKRGSVEINEFVRGEMERHRREELDDMLTAMLRLADEGVMTDAEIQSTVVLLVLAGYDTTAKTMGQALVALEQHPDQRRELAADPPLVPAALEEAMRWGGPAQFISPRLVMQDVVLGGVPLKEGETAITFPAAANRDPARWHDPNRFDIHREPKSHVGFGWGPHLCIGAPLARLEAQVAIEYLLRVAPEYTLRDVDLGNCFFMRGPERGFIEISHPVSA